MDGKHQEEGRSFQREGTQPKEPRQNKSKCLDLLKMMCCGYNKQKSEHTGQETEQKVLSASRQDIPKHDTLSYTSDPLDSFVQGQYGQAESSTFDAGLKQKWKNLCKEYERFDDTLAYLETRNTFTTNKEMKIILNEYKVKMVQLRYQFAGSWGRGDLEQAAEHMESFKVEKGKIDNCLKDFIDVKEEFRRYKNYFSHIKDFKRYLECSKQSIEKAIFTENQNISFFWKKEARNSRLKDVMNEIKEFGGLIENFSMKYSKGYLPENNENVVIINVRESILRFKAYNNYIIDSIQNKGKARKYIDIPKYNAKEINRNMEMINEYVDKLHLYQETQRKSEAARCYVPETYWDHVAEIADEKLTAAITNCNSTFVFGTQRDDRQQALKNLEDACHVVEGMADMFKKTWEERTTELKKQNLERYEQCSNLYTKLGSGSRTEDSASKDKPSHRTSDRSDHTQLSHYPKLIGGGSDWYQREYKLFEEKYNTIEIEPKPNEENKWEQMLEKHYQELNNKFLNLSLEASNKGIESESTAIDLVTAEEATEAYLGKLKPQERIAWEELSMEDSLVEAEMRANIENRLKKKNNSLNSDLAGMFKEVDPELRTSFITILQEEMKSHDFLEEEIDSTIGYVSNGSASAGQ